MVHFFEESQSTVATEKHISPKAQINNVSSTLMSIEVKVPVYQLSGSLLLIWYFFKLNNLRSCTRAEVILFTTSETTDLPLHGLSFATKGVSKFLEHGLKMDTQEFLCKMEGFAIQGVQGESIYLYMLLS